MSDEKYVGAIAAAKNVALTKAALDKKLDKSGGTIAGTLEVTSSLTTHSSIEAGNYIKSDLLLMAPTLALNDEAKDATIFIGVAGENAAKVTSDGSDGKLRYARLAVGAPTGDNDAATKAYVDSTTRTTFDVWLTSTEPEYTDGMYVFPCASDADYTELFNLAKNGAFIEGALYSGSDKDDRLSTLLFGSVSGEAGFGSLNFTCATPLDLQSENGLLGSVMHITFMDLGETTPTILLTGGAGYVPSPNPDNSDDGKSFVVNGHKWEMKKVDVVTESTNGLMSAADKKKLDGMYDIVATSTDGETFDITPTQLHEKLKGVPTTCAIKVGDMIIPLCLVYTDASGSTSYVFRAIKDAGAYKPHAKLSYTASSGGTSSGTNWVKLEQDLTARTPNILKFTGAANATFNGLEDVTIDIPTGEGAVRYDESQELTSDQKSKARTNIGAVGQNGAWMEGTVMLLPSGNDGASVVNITPGGKNDNYTITLDAGPENIPVRVAGIETPTDAQTDSAANVAYVKAKIAEVAASGGVDVDNALSTTSTNPVQNKVITSALTGKASTAVATTSANGLMSKADKTKLDGIAAGATKITIDSAMSDTSANPVQNKVIASALAGKAGTAAATTSTAGLMSAADKTKLDGIAEGANKVTVDTALDASSTNPVQNKVIASALAGKAGTAAATTSTAGLMSAADKTKLDGIAAGATKITIDSAMSDTSTNPVQNKAVKAALNGKMDSSPGFIEMNPGSVGHGGYIDFHYNGSTADYTSRIIEDSSGSINVPNTLKVGGSKVLTEDSISSLLLKMYPVGAIYISTVSTSPATLFGGTWTQIKDRFLLAAGSSYTAGKTGGAATHTLTTSEMPSHNHAVYYPNAGAGDHSAPGNYPDGDTDSTYYAVGSYTSSAGGGGAHNNMPPYLVVYVWKRTA